MIELSALWLPILLTAVVVFFISFVMWMVSPHHNSDWGPLSDEDRLMDVLRELGAGAGQYTFPHVAERAQLKDPAWMARFDRGPKGFLILKPEGPVNVGRSMLVSFLFNAITAALVAYAATLVLPAGAATGLVFRFFAVVAFLANAFALGWGAIWFGRSWTSTFKEVLDGLVYGLATAGVFAWLWPAA